MLREIINRLRGPVRLRVRCPYPERVLNLCSARNLAFWDLEWEGENQFTCRVSRQDFRVLRQNGEKLNCEFHVLGREGAPYALGRLRRRQALAAGLLLWGVWLVLSSVLIWDIRITGNETVPKEEILRSLEKKGFVSRRTDENDRRRIMVSSTPAGSDYVKNGRELLRSRLSAIINAMGSESAENFIRSMEEFVNACRKADFP